MKRRRIAGWTWRFDDRYMVSERRIAVVRRCRGRKCCKLRRVVRFERTGTGVDADVVQCAAFRGFELDLGGTAIVCSFCHLERHRAGQDRQVQRNHKQQGTDPATAEASPTLCEPFDHGVFVDVYRPQSKETNQYSGENQGVSSPSPVMVRERILWRISSPSTRRASAPIDVMSSSNSIAPSPLRRSTSCFSSILMKS